MSGLYTNNANILQKNVTLQNIIQLHDTIVQASNYVQQGGFGDIFELDIDQTQLFPVCWLSIENASYTKNELTYNLRLYVMDLVDLDETNENDVLSDALQMIGDYISQLRHGFSYGGLDWNMEHDYRVSDNINCEPFTERFDSQVSGWAANISITVSFNASACLNDTM